MGSKKCMNEKCCGTTSLDLKRGWSLKSGGFASLCYKCGSAYENSVFCETYHSDESGWRECKTCRKILHCGCIASKHLFEYMDVGGVACISCVKRLEIQSLQPMQIPNIISGGKSANKTSSQEAQPILLGLKVDDETRKLLQMSRAIGSVPPAVELEKEESVIRYTENSKRVQSHPQNGSSSVFAKPNYSRPKQGVKDMYESLALASLKFSLTSHLASSSSVLAIPAQGAPVPGGMVESNETSKGSLQHGQKAHHVSPKPPKPIPAGSEANKGSASQARVPRPPTEGRGSKHLLPRYWPKITDQELQQLSGDFNSTIVPLFEKTLSASDAGRIGRLVLPKACAEAYFPTINQSEGIPIRIQDIKGKEWTFQFRFWPNNNSRMYVLEGVTPCIQNMQLQAGDTVIFSRIDPGSQLVIGCRKAANNTDVQEPQAPPSLNCDSLGEASSSGVNDTHTSNGGQASDDPQPHLTTAEKKKARNIKNKRLHMNNDEASELRVTWEEAQELLRPAPSSEPTVVTVDGYEFEEFEEPPVFGKKTIFISQPSGEQEQLVQCDSCSKWRRLPANALLSAKWLCSDNIWDSSRAACSAPEDVSPGDLDSSSLNKENKKQRCTESAASKGGEPSGLDALANAAVLGDSVADAGDNSAGATTKHPRHRPGCTCIVCIQPPSGKGKHEPSCKCNVCLTVRRRFKTLMMRKKKKQSDREEKEKEDSRAAKEDIAGMALLDMNNPGKETGGGGGNGDQTAETSRGGGLDLNCDPRREDEILAESSAAFSPVDVFAGQNGE
ncbi:B3 domain-containing transcription repressor VAL1-like isoform X1 [Salvia splendens]|uniref:B3 domain-containing transcription repressor VAL1-like isoform X1 n=1 Tax=Salvia splendens TaxID=180675 RepID=UPI001C2590EF|nr:B3 domain-containing transcription repressor VAL1-like isoform X1 [Salvia splendens]XP_041999194.1 B3 domain-containing transcription repressor VAL1-like isoform X1 [Salvia splendens]XP_041999195.1 B3 domain-containing transcription repressor VAL1-like isoform X1 [Salvia splendens]